MISINVTGADGLIMRLESMKERLSDLRPAMEAAGEIVSSGARQRIKDQGGDQDWPPSKSGGHTGVKSSRMLNSIQSHTEGTGSSLKVVVGTNVRYAQWFQNGTGIYAGHSQWTIVPKNGSALRFVIGGKVIFARKVVMLGQPPRPFLIVGDQERSRILNLLRRYIVNAVTLDPADEGLS